MNLSLVSPPVVEPVSLAEAKAHLRADGADEDTYIASLITAARRWVESDIGRALLTQTWDYPMGGFPRARTLEIPRPPLQSVTSITYYDADLSTSTVFSSSLYQVDALVTPGVVGLKAGEAWPSDQLRPSSGVVVRFTAGYGATASSVPEDIRHAVKLLVAQMYVHREPEITGTITSRVKWSLGALLRDFRSWGR